MAGPIETPPIRKLKFAPGETAIAVAVILFAIVTLTQTLAIPVSPLYSRVGPTVAPTLVWIGLGALGLGLLRFAIRGGWQPVEEQEIQPDYPALAWVAAGLLANVLLIKFTGFTIASVIMFTLICRGFGSKRLMRDIGIGFALALIAYFGFSTALRIDIGRGPFEQAVFDAIAMLRGN
jgi:putative tricarboxylic transport membrane protein